MKNVFPVIVLGMASVLAGCGRSSDVASSHRQATDTDVTLSPKYNFSSFAGTIWKTKVKMAVADVKHYTNERDMDLLPPDAFDPTHPRYNPPIDMHIQTVLPVGTRLRIERLMKDNGNWGGVRVVAALENETNFQNTVYLDEGLLAKNRFVWQGESSSTNWGVDPDMLEK